MNHKKQTPAGLAGILLLGAALSGCNYNTANDGIRNGPQAVHPSTSALAQRTSAGAPVAVAGISPADVTDVIFPDVKADTGIAGPIRAFARTCMAHAPDLGALFSAAKDAGFSDLEREGKSIYGAQFTGATPVSFQVNVNTRFAHECAVTVVVDQKNTTNVREAFFNALQTPHRNGVAQIVVNGKKSILKHQEFQGGAFGVNEHAFLLQQN